MQIIVIVCLYYTPSHYHHCANLSEDIELLSDKFCRVCDTICGAVCFQFTHFPCDDWENIYTLSYYHHQIGSMNYSPLFRVTSWNNGVRCMSFYILKEMCIDQFANLNHPCFKTWCNLTSLLYTCLKTLSLGIWGRGLVWREHTHIHTQIDRDTDTASLDRHAETEAYKVRLTRYESTFIIQDS